MGMIESYDSFTMPGLYRVRSGLDPRLARHNIVPPGASEDFFFPNHDTSRRIEGVSQSLANRLLQSDAGHDCVGELLDPSKPFVFAMARMDRIKNLSGLVDLFGKHSTLREHANLLLITSLNRAELSRDAEEIAEVNRTYELIEEHQLAGHFRWAAARLDKTETGEIYRMIADGKGVFAQPAFMETFGLTVIEAMACGTPVVVTCFGGPAEIVVDGKSGFVVNPNDHQAFGDALNRIVSDSQLWQQLSTGGIQRVNEAFTWNRHAEKVLRLANVYEYWNHLDVMNRHALDQYIHTLYHTVYRPRLSTIHGG
jgi:sucrose synthase